MPTKRELEQIWKLEKLALEQDYFSLEFAAQKLGLTPRRTFTFLKQIKSWNFLKQYNLPGKRGRPKKLFRLRLKDLKHDKSREIFEYIEKIKDRSEAIILFGSYLTNYFDESSDIDILVQTKTTLPTAPKEIEVLKIRNFNEVPALTRYNILNNGAVFLTKKALSSTAIDFSKAINERKNKIKEDLKLLEIAEFPESVGFLCKIAMDIGYFLILKENKIPTCWKETKKYIECILPEINLLYPYYLKYLKERNVKELNLNKQRYFKIKNKVILLWQQIQKNSLQGRFLQQTMWV